MMLMMMTRMMVNMVRGQTVRCTPKVVRTPQAANDDDDDNDDDEEKDDGEYGEQANWLVQCTPKVVRTPQAAIWPGTERPPCCVFLRIHQYEQCFKDKDPIINI